MAQAIHLFITIAAPGVGGGRRYTHLQSLTVVVVVLSSSRYSPACGRSGIPRVAADPQSARDKIKESLYLSDRSASYENYFYFYFFFIFTVYGGYLSIEGMCSEERTGNFFRKRK